jgi:hypothetical protein
MNIILLNQINIYKQEQKNMLISIKTNRHFINANKILYKTFGKLGIKIPDIESQLMHKYVDYTGQEASDQIKAAILENNPLMIARFGSVELKCIVEYCSSLEGFKKYVKYITGFNESYKISNKSYKQSFNNAGVFPSNPQTLSKFSELMLEDMKQIDILGSWLSNERHINKHLKKCIKVKLPDLEPYYHTNPWTSALAGKTVLVIHPFAKSIKNQYKHKRTKLFENPNILPEFELKTIKAVQSVAGNKTEFSDWFEALNHMKKLINETDFDIAIIGCGAYGFPLAAHIKRMGKQAIHMGGSTQLLFGIKGKRWDNHELISNLFNEHWVRPNKDETPEKIALVEGGSYW